MSAGIPLIRPPVLDPLERALRDLTVQVDKIKTAPIVTASPISLTGQTATIATTNVITLAKSGIYEIKAVLQCTTSAVGAGTLTLTLGWTSRATGETDPALTRILTAIGSGSRSYLIQVTGDTNITYAVSIAGIFSTAVYALEIRSVRVSD